MSISAFPNKDQEPTMQDVSAIAGAKLPLWEDLVAFISENYQIEGVFRYYGKSYGWQLWFQRSRKTLVSLYPQQDGFVVQIVLGPTLVDAASQLSLGTNVRRTLEGAQQYPEGKWLFIEVSSKEDIEDVKKLLLLKRKPGKKNIRKS
jgi:hypothetical protein